MARWDGKNPPKNAKIRLSVECDVPMKELDRLGLSVPGNPWDTGSRMWMDLLIYIQSGGLAFREGSDSYSLDYKSRLVVDPVDFIKFLEHEEKRANDSNSKTGR
jgi:hypothetical protein